MKASGGGAQGPGQSPQQLQVRDTGEAATADSMLAPHHGHFQPPDTDLCHFPPLTVRANVTVHSVSKFPSFTGTVPVRNSGDCDYRPFYR